VKFQGLFILQKQIYNDKIFIQKQKNYDQFKNDLNIAFLNVLLMQFNFYSAYNYLNSNISHIIMF
jgi:hypothetical protein